MIGLDPMRLDLVLFGRDGVAARRLAVDIGPLPGSRTVVRLFDVASRAACADRAALASRVPSVTFEK